jgi:hypothetical protein
LTANVSDLELARRLDEAEAFTAEVFARRLVQRRPSANMVIEEIAGGRAVFADTGSPLTEAKAVGLHGPVTDADLDRMEALFFDQGESPRGRLPPRTDLQPTGAGRAVTWCSDS